MTFTDIQTICEAVRKTAVHENESERVEFAVAVKLIPYTRDVISVWVYCKLLLLVSSSS